MNRGEIWWANLPEPIDSSPGYRRPVVIIQSDGFNKANLNTSIVAMITKNTELAKMRGNVLIKKHHSGLLNDSVINVTQVYTLDKFLLFEYIETLSERKMEQVDKGLRLVLSL